LVFLKQETAARGMIYFMSQEKESKEKAEENIIASLIDLKHKFGE